MYSLESEDVFSVNDSFTSRLNRVKIRAISVKGDTEHERQETRSNEDRNYEIEAAIIRIMKVQKRLMHGVLVTKVKNSFIY